jgi:hypothetical protein
MAQPGKKSGKELPKPSMTTFYVGIVLIVAGLAWIIYGFATRKVDDKNKAPAPKKAKK